MAIENGPPAEWFDRWWSPGDFFPMVLKHNDALPSGEFFSSRYQPLREAYAAGVFAWILAKDRTVLVRLDGGDFPDFELKFDDGVVGFELVEAIAPGCRRAEEYREAARRAAAGLPEALKDFDLIEERNAAIRAIQDAVESKAAKKYNPAPHLLVYVNFWLFDKPPLTPEQFEELLRPWRESFPAVWLLWGSNAIRCWPDPVRLVGVPPGLFP